MTKIINESFDAERALYESVDLEAINCRFEGEADGESAFKECKNIKAVDCFFDLRYPFWHDEKVVIEGSEMTQNCRASLWYSNEIKITNTKMHGIKALRECKGVKIKDCDIISPEFGWSTTDLVCENTTAVGEYFMMRGENLRFENLNFSGKYSFQYIKNAHFENCVLNTKDAFWHAENITVKNCVVNGEYLAWYCKNVTFENCKISGTQPLCYCENLKMINCELTNADLCFERSSVEATITTPIISVKNLLSGFVEVPRIDEIICDSPKFKGEVKITK